MSTPASTTASRSCTPWRRRMRTCWPPPACRATSRRARSPSTREPSSSSPAGPTSRSRSAARRRSSGRSRRPRRRTDRGGWGTPSCPPPTQPLSTRHAVDLIVDEARRRPGEITLVTLGPLTNLAIAVLREPALPRLLRGYTLMGGAFGVSGNTTPTTEWNIHCDPEAARIVLRAWTEARLGRPVDPAAAGARARRHRAGSDPARRRRPAGAPGRQHARRLDRPGPRRGPDARHSLRGRQPGRPLRGRRAALLHGVPCELRRVLRGVHPRPAGRRRRAGPRPGHDRGAVRRRRDTR